MGRFFDLSKAFWVRLIGTKPTSAVMESKLLSLQEFLLFYGFGCDTLNNRIRPKTSAGTFS